MNREEKDIFDFLEGLSEEDSQKLIEDINIDDFELNDLQKQRMKSKVMNKISVKSNRKLNKGLIAAGISGLLVFSGFTPFGQKVIADIAKKLLFIPGIGRVVENQGYDIYVLQKEVKHQYNNGEITVKTAVRDKNNIFISLVGTNSNIAMSDLKMLNIVDGEGKKYSYSSCSVGTGGELWEGSFNFDKIPEAMNSFKIAFPDNSEISIDLSKAQSFEDYVSMGPSDIKNGLGITIMTSKDKDRIKLNLIQHPLKDKKIVSYGEITSYEKNETDISVKDEAGKSYKLGYPSSYSGVLSEFYFTPSQNVGKYVVEIPEVHLQYKINKKIEIPLPREGMLNINKDFDINGFIFTVKGVYRDGNNIKVHVDTNYDKNKAENLSELRVDINRGGYGWKINEDNKTVEYYEFEVSPKDKSLRLKFSDMETILKGPWKFEISQAQ